MAKKNVPNQDNKTPEPQTFLLALERLMRQGRIEEALERVEQNMAENSKGAGQILEKTTVLLAVEALIERGAIQEACNLLACDIGAEARQDLVQSKPPEEIIKEDTAVALAKLLLRQGRLEEGKT